MEWTRHPWVRAIAVAASLTLVIAHRADRGVWFWVGVVLFVINARALLAARTRVADGQPASSGDDHEHRLVDLISLPGVAAALAAGPPLWRQVSHLDADLGPSPVEEIAEYVWLSYDDGWEIQLGDEVKPYLDLDIDEVDDPVISILKGHPSVADAFHEDRELYRAVQRSAMPSAEFAELAARALVAHHVFVAANA